jgi:predicted dehydrogenase
VNPIRIALVGLGKIAKDRHIPALAASTEFELVAAAIAPFADDASQR